jgi:hypothetical protein
MTTIGDIIKENNLKVETSVVNQNYICRIKDGADTFEFSMTEEKLVEHIRRFNVFHETILANENMKKTHFLRLAVTWWHIQVMNAEAYHQLNIK